MIYKFENAKVNKPKTLNINTHLYTQISIENEIYFDEKGYHSP